MNNKENDYPIGNYTVKFDDNGKPYALDDGFERQSIVLHLDAYDDSPSFLYFSNTGENFTAVRLGDDGKPDGFVAMDELANDMALEACEDIWKGKVTPVYLDKDVIDLDLIADAFGWKKDETDECHEVNQTGLKDTAERVQKICGEKDTYDEIDRTGMEIEREG